MMVIFETADVSIQHGPLPDIQILNHLLHGQYCGMDHRAFESFRL